jgi:hypothetical protein
MPELVAGLTLASSNERSAESTGAFVSTQDNHRVGNSKQRIHIRELRGKIPEFQSDFISELAMVEAHQPALGLYYLQLDERIISPFFNRASSFDLRLTISKSSSATLRVTFSGVLNRAKRNPLIPMKLQQA